MPTNSDRMQTEPSFRSGRWYSPFMSNVTLEIPEEFARSFGNSEAEVKRNAGIELALEMYREGRWSTGKASQFSGMYIGDFMDLLRDRGIGKPYTMEMLQQDIAYARGRV
jgi:predicted HTH domain antitoxin